MLSKYAQDNNEDDLNIEIKSCLPDVLDAQAKICKTPDCSIKDIDEEVYVSTYYVGGHDIAEPALVRVWVWMI